MRARTVVSVVLILSVASPPVAGAETEIEWVRQFGSPVHDEASSVAPTPDGGALVGGSFDLEGGRHAFVRRYDALGDILWADTFTNGSGTHINGIARSDDATFVTGWTGGAFPGETYAGLVDVFVRRYDDDGTVVWTTQFGGANSERPYGGIVIDPDERIRVAGQTLGMLGDEPAAGAGDAFVATLTLDGVIERIDQFGTGAEDQATGIAVGAGDTIFVAGWTNGAFEGKASGGASDVFLARLNAGGDLDWVHQSGGAHTDMALDVDVAGSDVYLVGVQGQDGGSGDAFASRFDQHGTLVWSRAFGVSGYALANSVDISRHGVVTAGHVRGDLTPGGSHGSTDGFARAFSHTGDVLWTRHLGTTSVDHATDVGIGDPGVVFVGGFTSGTLPTQTSSGNRDAFLMKLRWTVDVEGPLVRLVRPEAGVVYLDALGVELQTDLDHAVVIDPNSSFQLRAEATDPSGVAVVRFLVDGAILCEVAAPPYVCDWPHDALALDTTIEVEAVDVFGNTSGRDSVRVLLRV